MSKFDHMRKQTIWIICFSHLNRDPRVHRQVQWLADDFNIVTVGFSPPAIPSIKHVPIVPPATPHAWHNPQKWIKKARNALLLASNRFETYYWSRQVHRDTFAAINHLHETPDLVIANDIETLPIALAAAKNNRVIVDLHEYAPREAEDQWQWRLFFQSYIDYLCKTYLPKTDASFTVCQGIANEYSKIYEIHPKIITNAPSFHDLNPTPIKNDQIRMIYHGAAIASRCIEDIILLMNELNGRFVLDLILVPGDPNYIKKIMSLAENNPKIRFLPPQPMQDLPKFLNQYDIGLFYLPPTNFNYHHALPNKFFEFIQARLAVAIGPSPEMSHYVKKYDCGIVSNSFNIKDLGNMLSQLTSQQLMHYKQRSHEAAKTLHAENNREIMMKTINALLK